MRGRGSKRRDATSFCCPVAGCESPVADPRRPCDECLETFGDMLREVSVEEQEQGIEEAAATLAERDAAVRSVYAERREDSAGIEWRANQCCWRCEERRRCRRDPTYPERWVCRDCHERHV